ncbi:MULTISPECIES: SDR family oxidoreductase [Chryseobacterium]|uniref:Tropinone reductase 1 n=1 Tax=Chryseobacterium camelliae TaxID=1265445 RepID=A0ABU0TI55_9FLAO|nr:MULTISPECIES: SDR family oxidoreductase [Chryseobacterium]MDT3406377.1 Tropinone reductase 1 [Pseudacidovorax intermedius]MDQ1095823.1 Tropinone reductase 1 [Chryseobacterium camelliae]MDQ1099760.1 Tropinone reductase 1 [Chryseobacterium sp. SORGH_AS_1048]MDR6087108.1 Tropinone reductase 1 [Chryseobacterium sp. SORGH_AS_0909]MDR6131481.1 Tropinone reductase 1 [Chryseobacterium sp. SORGH_AS_1175]
MSHWNLNNKRILVTGGTKGIGKATVIELADLGAQVLFTGRDQESVNLVEKELQEMGLEVSGIMADVTSSDHRHKITEWIGKNWKSLDVLVNNAGINIRKPTMEYQEREYRQLLEINLIAPFELAMLLHPYLKKAKLGVVINVASVAGIMDARTGAPYGMSKGGLIQLGRNLANEWAADHIRVNTVSPWFTMTPATERVLSNEEKLKKIIDRTPLKRVAEDKEIAAVIAFLSMDKASFVNGQNIVVDGGATAAIL